MLPIRLQVQNSDTATRTHIHVRREQARQDFVNALTYRAVSTIAMVAITVLGVFAIIGAAALIEQERRLELQARV